MFFFKTLIFLGLKQDVGVRAEGIGRVRDRFGIVIIILSKKIIYGSITSPLSLSLSLSLSLLSKK